MRQADVCEAFKAKCNLRMSIANGVMAAQISSSISPAGCWTKNLYTSDIETQMPKAVQHPSLHATARSVDRSVYQQTVGQ